MVAKRTDVVAWCVERYTHVTVRLWSTTQANEQYIGNYDESGYRFLKLGGKLVYGTDTGLLPDYNQGEEFRQLMQARLGFRMCCPRRRRLRRSVFIYRNATAR